VKDLTFVIVCVGLGYALYTVQRGDWVMYCTQCSALSLNCRDPNMTKDMRIMPNFTFCEPCIVIHIMNHILSATRLLMKMHGTIL
jgi:hypothetical protein